MEGKEEEKDKDSGDHREDSTRRGAGVAEMFGCGTLKRTAEAISVNAIT